MNYLSEAIEMKVKAIPLICYQYSEVRAYLLGSTSLSKEVNAYPALAMSKISCICRIYRILMNIHRGIKFDNSGTLLGM